jgi:hypothetical protein
MDIYLAYCETPRHDALIETFKNRDEAIKFAKNAIYDNSENPESVKEENMKGYEYYLDSESESTYAFVKKCKLR